MKTLDSKPFLQQIGRRISRMRKIREITQKEMVQGLKITQGYLSRLEKGDVKSLDIVLLLAIADKLNVQVEYFLKQDSVTSIEYIVPKEEFATSYKNIKDEWYRLQNQREMIEKQISELRKQMDALEED